MKMSRAREAVWVALCVVLGACGGGTHVESDAGSHPAIDAGSDAAIDPASDAGSDASIDAGSDAGSEPICVDEDGDGYGVECAAGSDCDDADPSVHPGATDTCDGTDEDCNGAIDTGCECETGAMRACGSDVGACVVGSQSCEDGTWAACDGAVEPDVETCWNAADEDCDGDVDEECGPCPILTVSCAAGCCAIPEAQIVARGSFPSLAIDSAGRLFVAYVGMGTGPIPQARLSRYEPTTATWSDQLLGNGVQAIVRVGADDRVHVLFSLERDGTPRYQRSDDSGATWTAMRTFSAQLGFGGTLDLELEAPDRIHVTYEAADASLFNKVRYSHYDGTSWSSMPFDASADEPRIGVGFGGRPSIVYEGSSSVTPSNRAMRQLFFDGSSWVTQDIESGAYYSVVDAAFATNDVEVATDDSARMIYTRRVGTTDELVLAQRTAGPTGTWTTAVLSGTSAFTNPRLGRASDGTPFVVSDGLRLHRPGAGGAWSSTDVGIAGTEPAIAQAGDVVYVVYTGTRPGATRPLLLTRITL